MLRIKYRDSVVPSEYSGVLDSVKDLSLSETINGDRTLTFTVPYLTYLPIGSLVICEGQEYRLVRTEGNPGESVRTATCQHSFNFDSKKAFIPNIGSTKLVDLIGVRPYKVLEYAIERLDRHSHEADNPFKLFTKEELAERGLTWMGGVDSTDPSLNIDFETTDKTTLWDVVVQVISLAGRGEIYAENHKFAIVDRIGIETNSTILTSSLVENVTVEYDVSEMVTVLYPYGRDGLEITNKEIDGTKYGLSYIKAEGISEYIDFAGYRDYDITNVDELYKRALWEFDEANPNRICVPSVNISGTADALHLPNSIGLGDTVGVMISNMDKSSKSGRVRAVNERIISIKSYPFTGKPPEICIGKVKKDMFFYLNQIGVLSQRYKNVSSIDGKIFGASIKGRLSVNGHYITTDSNGNLLYDGVKIN